MTLVEITAVGAMVKPSGDDRYRPKVRGDRVDVDEAVALRLVGHGTAVIVDSTQPAEDAEAEQPDAGVIDLETATITQLRKFANARRIPGIGSLRTRPEIVEAIEAALTDPESEDDDG